VVDHQVIEALIEDMIEALIEALIEVLIEVPTEKEDHHQEDRVVRPLEDVLIAVEMDIGHETVPMRMEETDASIVEEAVI